MKTIFMPEEIDALVTRLAGEIDAYYADKTLSEPVLVVGVLKGAFVFLADLIRKLTIPVELEFIRTSSYGTNFVSSGRIQLLAEPAASPANRSALIVEDMIDTGLTLEFVRDYFVGRSAADVQIAVLLDKKARRVIDVECRFVGSEVENRYVGGYGLDGGRFFAQRRDIFLTE